MSGDSRGSSWRGGEAGGCQGRPKGLRLRHRHSAPLYHAPACSRTSRDMPRPTRKAACLQRQDETQQASKEMQARLEMLGWRASKLLWTASSTQSAPSSRAEWMGEGPAMMPQDACVLPLRPRWVSLPCGRSGLGEWRQHFQPRHGAQKRGLSGFWSPHHLFRSASCGGACFFLPRALLSSFTLKTHARFPPLLPYLQDSSGV